jgi:glutamate-1-semialdehyde aminotransferase
MLNEGVLMATRGLMIGSTPMTDADIDETIERSGRAFARFAADATASAA